MNTFKSDVIQEQTNDEEDDIFELTTTLKDKTAAENKKIKTKYEIKFKQEWLKQFNWLQPDENVKQGKKCIYCGHCIAGGFTHLKRHEESVVHKKLVNKAIKNKKTNLYLLLGSSGTTGHCCICCNKLQTNIYREIFESKTIKSRPIIKVLEDITGKELIKNDVRTSYFTCENCFTKLNEYDEAHLKMIEIQKEFLNILEQKNIEKDFVKSNEEDGIEIISYEKDRVTYLIEAKPGQQMHIGKMIDKYEIETKQLGEEYEIVSNNDSGSGNNEFHKMNETLVDNRSYEDYYDTNVEVQKELDIEEIEALNEYEINIKQEEGYEIIKNDDSESSNNKSNKMNETLVNEKNHEEFYIFEFSEEQHVLKTKSQTIKKRICEYCGENFENVKDFYNHKNRKHTKETIYVCQICGAKYKSRHILKTHIAMHNGESPYKCEICNKLFSQKCALQRHLALHTGEKFYKCDICFKEFVHHSSFTMHKAMHNDIRNAKCKICSKLFRSNSHLNRHMKIHSGERNHACPECGQRFAQRYNMKAHFQTNHLNIRRKRKNKKHKHKSSLDP